MRALRSPWLAVALLAAAPGCGPGDEAGPPAAGPRSKIGSTCTVQFRRDALGTAAALPVSPRTQSLNGAETSITGVLRAVKGDWLVLDVSQRLGNVTINGVTRENVQHFECWVPTETILYLEWPSAQDR